MTASARVLGSLAGIPAAVWDGLANPADRPFNPFVTHAFLKALEDSGSTGGRSGWQSAHLVLEDGGAIETMRVIVSDAHFPKQNVKLPPRVQRLKPSPREMETVTAFRDTVTAERRWSEPFDLPIPGCLTSPFGVRRWYNGKPSGNYHAGIDQASPAGTPIHAIAGGVVRLVREFNIHGHVVGVDHGQGLSSIYLHMSKFAVAEGAQVQKGDVIGYVGSTGRSTAPHLHWSLYANGMSINPTKWITPPACRPTAPTPPAKSPTSSKK